MATGLRDLCRHVAEYGLGKARTLIRQASVFVCELVSNDCGATFHRRVAGAIASARGFT